MDPRRHLGIALALGWLATSCAPAAPRAEEPWTYEVTVTPDGSEADVRVHPPTRAHEAAQFERGGEAFAKGLAEVGGEIHYRFQLADAAAALHGMDRAIAFDGAILASPSVWLAHPRGAVPFWLRVRGPIASGLPRAPSGEYRGEGLMRAPLATMGSGWHTDTIRVGESAVTVAIAPSHFRADDRVLVRWVQQTAANVAEIYGRFPLPQALIVVVPQDGNVFATTIGGGAGGSVVMPLTRDTTAEDLRDEWALTHEMLHLAFPSVTTAHRWIDEGLATYMEPLVRARAGIISPDDVWRDLLTEGKTGLPGPGDPGLERATARERVYWGGALFWLSVDVAIREKSGGARSLEDAMRAVLEGGGNVSTVWDIERIVGTCDRALGDGVAREHYARLGLSPGAVDLDGIAKRLGVALDGDAIVYDDAAPLASIRRALTKKR